MSQTTSYYSVPLSYLNTFTSADPALLMLGDLADGNRYYLQTDTDTPIPTSDQASFTELSLTNDQAEQLRMVCVESVSSLVWGLNEYQVKVNNTIDQLVQYHISQGFDFSGNNAQFRVVIAGYNDLTNISGIATIALAVKQGLAPDTQIKFNDATGVVWSLTADDAILLGHQTFEFVTAQYDWGWSKKAQINAATDIDTINSVFNSGA